MGYWYDVSPPEVAPIVRRQYNPRSHGPVQDDESQCSRVGDSKYMLNSGERPEVVIHRTSRNDGGISSGVLATTTKEGVQHEDSCARIMH